MQVKYKEIYNRNRYIADLTRALQPHRIGDLSANLCRGFNRGAVLQLIQTINQSINRNAINQPRPFFLPCLIKIYKLMVDNFLLSL